MVNIFIEKEWESQFFNRRIFSLELPIVGIKNNDVPKDSLVTIKVNSADYSNLNALNKYAFSLVEGELLFRKALPLTVKPVSLDFNVHIATESSLNELKFIVRDLYENSRFREPWFTPEERNVFYQMWLENAVLSKFDDCCLILKSEGAITGFVTIRTRQDEATIGLIGVAEPFQGQGIGKELLKLAQDYCISKEVKFIKVATQTSNIAAANLYSKTGFTITDISYWFYKQV